MKIVAGSDARARDMPQDVRDMFRGSWFNEAWDHVDLSHKEAGNDAHTLKATTISHIEFLAAALTNVEQLQLLLQGGGLESRASIDCAQTVLLCCHLSHSSVFAQKVPFPYPAGWQDLASTVLSMF